MPRFPTAERGSALIAVLMLLALLSALLTAYFAVTRIELSTTKSSMDATRGFYAAEAGLNLRAQEIRQSFLGYNRPAGTTPVVPAGQLPCAGGDLGAGDFACESRLLGGRNVATHVEEAAGNPTLVRIPAGERYQDLFAQEYSYTIESVAGNSTVHAEAVLGMQFRSRLVPMFQFAAFYNKDLEIHPGPPMTLAGPVHSNGDLYLGSSGGLSIVGQVTTAGDLYQGTKTSMLCYAGGVTVPAPTLPNPLPACPTTATVLYDQPTLDAGWNGMIRTDVDPLTVPPPEAFDPGDFYWDRADVRIVLKVAADGTTAIELRNVDESVDVAGSATLNGCGTMADPAVDTSDTFYNIREAKPIRMLDVDVQRLLNCLDDNPPLMGGAGIDETSDGGLAWYLTVEGPDSASAANGYGVRLQNGGEIASDNAGAPNVRGLTVISDQAAYVHGDLNATNWVPVAVMSDSINVLSNDYVDGDHLFALGTPERKANETRINAAFLAGTDTTGGVEGVGGQNGAYNGGLENYPRLHEKWSGIRLIYRGSFVSLNTPRHVNGPHQTPGLYNPPIRDWGFDVQFNDAMNLPPLTPQFVYVKQDMFIRDYDL